MPTARSSGTRMKSPLAQFATKADNDDRLSSAYASLHIDTSRHNLEYSDFPISNDMPDYIQIGLGAITIPLPI
jgi:hypothetical protein